MNLQYKKLSQQKLSSPNPELKKNANKKKNIHVKMDKRKLGEVNSETCLYYWIDFGKDEIINTRWNKIEILFEKKK